MKYIRQDALSLKTKKLEIEIVERNDHRWMLCVPASSVRIGETDREQVKKKDYKWKTQKQKRDWKVLKN